MSNNRTKSHVEIFTPEQERAIKEKMTLYQRLKEDGISQKEFYERILAIEDEIVRKRLEQFEKDKTEGKLWYLESSKFNDMTKAFLLIFLSYMNIVSSRPGWIARGYFNEAGIEAQFLYLDDQGHAFINIETKTFCPYLQAFRRLGFDAEKSAYLCEHTLERPCQVLVDKVNPRIKFSRNYHHVRPITDYCFEILGTADSELIERIDLECTDII